MTPLKDFTGQRWGKLVALSLVERRGYRTYWLFQCDCGDTKVACISDVKNGNTNSCGCLTTRKFKDLTGEVFERLTVLGLAGKNDHGDRLWLCLCSCGNETTVPFSNLRKGNKGTGSCGCLFDERSHDNNFRTHGLLIGADRNKYPALYRKWTHIKERCYNPNSKSYKDCGGRGITMYGPWIDDYVAFASYCEEIEPNLYVLLEQGYSIDRTFNNDNYVPGNIGFENSFRQARNKRNTIYVNYRDSTMSIRDAYDVSGCTLKVLTVIARFKNGWNIDDALTLPLYRKYT